MLLRVHFLRQLQDFSLFLNKRHSLECIHDKELLETKGVDWGNGLYKRERKKEREITDTSEGNEQRED